MTLARLLPALFYPMLLVVNPPLSSQRSDKSTPAKSDQLYELKGDKLGEALSAFKANHSHTDCTATTTKITDCHVFDDVSIAGIAVIGTSACSSAATITPLCMQGIQARFLEQRLIYFSYTLFGDAAEKDKIVEALKKTYGVPVAISATLADWSNDLAILTVSVSKMTWKTGEQSFVNVMVQLKDDGSDKDI